MFLVISAAAPLTAVAGGVPLAMLLGNGAGVAGAVGLVTLILLLFAVGYVAMSRHVRNAGAFYAFAAQGLGAISGRGGHGGDPVLQLHADRDSGSARRGLGGHFRGDGPFAPVVGLVLYLHRADGGAGLPSGGSVGQNPRGAGGAGISDRAGYRSGHPGCGGDSGTLSMAPFAPSQVLSGVPSIAILFCFAFFIGFESTTIYSEEARDPKRSIPVATYGSVLLIGVFYMFTAWLMANGAGEDKLVPTLAGLADPTTFLFDLAGRYVGGPVPTIMGLLFITSLFAAVLAFHNGVARYKYVAGREGFCLTVWARPMPNSAARMWGRSFRPSSQVW
ncbi:APC family permease [Gemmobacter lanyuensis]